MSRFRVLFSPEAAAQLEKIEAWRYENRRENPTLVEVEVSEAIKAISTFPEVGTVHVSRRARGYRRILLPRTQYFLYYRVEPAQRLITVGAIWYSGRGKGPPLK